MSEGRSFLSIGKSFSHCRKIVRQWKQRSAKHLNTFPRVSRRFSKREVDIEDDEEDLQFSIESTICYFKASWKIFTFAELKIATMGFSEDNLIGQGGFAKVYKGRLRDGQYIAVKRLIRETQNEQSSSFYAELGVLVEVDHRNLAKLIGYGTDKGVHLVFQLSSLGSLGSLLRDWATRYRIAVGIAEGLKYLHDSCEKRLIHRDIKSDNILLGENYLPQICDFGLALWLPRQEAHLTVVNHEGSFGYIAPEYMMQGVVDEKTDVFAFGVVLLELITGRPALDESTQSILLWAKPLMYQNQVEGLVDPCLGDNYKRGQLARMVMTAALCVDPSSFIRPYMRQAVVLLKGDKPAQTPGSPSSTRTPSIDVLDTMDFNSAESLKELRRLRQVAFSSNSDLPMLSPSSLLSSSGCE